jgi:hypothetical protein
MEDWYKISSQMVHQNQGGALLKEYYQDSLAQALLKIYPEHNWQVWRFERTPNGFWKDTSKVKEYVDWLAKQLHLEKMEDWYTVSNDLLRQYGGNNLLKIYGGKAELLAAVFPEHKWNWNKFSMSQLQNQQRAFTVVKEIFPSHQVHINYRHVDLIFKSSGTKMEVSSLNKMISFKSKISQVGYFHSFHLACL